jgi:hypothetical protein
MSAPVVVDAHTDLLNELVARREEPAPFRDHWLGPLRAGGVAVQVCPIYPCGRRSGIPVTRRAWYRLELGGGGPSADMSRASTGPAFPRFHWRIPLIRRTYD